MDGDTGAVGHDIGQEDDAGHQQREAQPERYGEQDDVDGGRRSGSEELWRAAKKVEDGLGDGDGR